MSEDNGRTGTVPLSGGNRGGRARRRATEWIGWLRPTAARRAALSDEPRPPRDLEAAQGSEPVDKMPSPRAHDAPPDKDDGPSLLQRALGTDGEEEASLGGDGAAITQEDEDADLAAAFEMVDAEEAARSEVAVKERSGAEAAPSRGAPPAPRSRPQGERRAAGASRRGQPGFPHL